MKMDKSLPLQFTWNQPLPGVYLRAMMAFKPEQYKNDPVMRCLNHMAASNPVNQNMDPEKIKHVVHCVTHDHCTRYDETNGFLSTITKLGAPKLTRQGLQYEKMCFKFTCTNSCTGGMNRRHTELIFTLENARGKVLDCAKLSIRVCCCPKRDKRRDEKGLPMEDGPSNGDNAMPLAKMPSEHIYNVQLSIPGKENYLSVLKYAYDVMAGQAFKTGQHDFFKPYMEDILHKTA
ncbi:Tumor protein p73 [Ooceraea biroi]|nr:Tumor protein p73 [Ooceraea biroi]